MPGKARRRSTCEEFLEDLRLDAERDGYDVKVAFSGDPVVAVRPDAFKRCLANLIGNAQSHAGHISIEAVRDARFLTLHVDDDGPGIPPERREDVFRPFVRLDEARNQDEGGTGLGLAIARDIARSHGGDIALGESRAGGVRATVRVAGVTAGELAPASYLGPWDAKLRASAALAAAAKALAATITQLGLVHMFMVRF